MDVQGNRLTGVLVLMISLVAAFAVAALFYFLKIEQNENYQNQLHFRELSRYVSSLEQNKLSLEAAYEAHLTDQQQTLINNQRQLDDLVGQHQRVSTALTAHKQQLAQYNDTKGCPEAGCSAELVDQIANANNQLEYIAGRLAAETERQLAAYASNNPTKQQPMNECLSVFNNILNRAVYLRQCMVKVSAKDDKVASTANESSVSSLCHQSHKVCLDRQQGTMHTTFTTDSLKARPLADILQASSRMIPLVLLVDSNGKVLHKTENIKNDASQHGLRFEHLQQVLQQFSRNNDGKPLTSNPQSNAAGSPGKIAAGYSSYIDLDIAGTEFRLFIQPWSGIAFDQSAEPEMLYLLGLQSRSAMMGDKLAVSNSLVLIFTLLLIGLVALLPLLKVRLVSHQQGFSRNDLKVIPLSLAILCVLVSLSWFQLLFYQGLKTSLEQLAKSAFVDIQASFSTELTQWKTIAEQQIKTVAAGSARIDGTPDGLAANPERIAAKNCQEPKVGAMVDCLFTLQQGSLTLLEGVYLIDREKLQVDGLGVVASPQQYRKAPYSIQSRDYVKHASDCSGWRWPTAKGNHAAKSTATGVGESSANDCQNTFYVERLRNKLDMRLNTWVGMPLFSNVYPVNENGNNADVLIFGGQLKSFFLTVMPKDFRFLVFDNASGEVLYHSDEWLSKIDNIFADTDNNSHLRNLIKSLATQPVAFETKYKGKDAVFHLAAIAPNVPWTLVVMYDKSPYRLLNLLSAFSSWSLSFGYLLLLYLLWRVLPNPLQLQLTRVVWFCRSRLQLYRLMSGVLLSNLLFALGCFFFAAQWLWFSFAIVLALSAGYLFVCRYYPATMVPSHLIKQPLRIYSLFLLLLLLNFTAIPSVIFSNQTSEYLLFRQAQLHQQYLQSTAKTKQQQLAQHVNQYFDAAIFPNADKNALLASMRVNCYPKLLFGAGYQQYCNVSPNKAEGTGNSVAAPLDPITRALFSKLLPSDTYLGQIPWQLTNVQLPLFSEIWVMQQTQTLSDSSSTLPSNEQPMAMPEQLISHLIQSASMLSQLATWLAIALALLLLLLLIRFWLCRRMMGLDRVENFRINPDSRPCSNYKTYDALVKILYPHQSNGGQAVFLQLIRPSAATEELISNRQKKGAATSTVQQHCLIAGLTPVNVCDLRLPLPTQKQPLTPTSALPTLLLTGIEPLIWRKALRLEVLSKLQRLVEDGQHNLVFMLEMSPLYRLTRPQAYDENFPEAEQASAAEREAWVKLFVRFIKIYDWVPTQRQQQIQRQAADMLWHEASGWPELRHIAIQFLAYHCAAKDPSLALLLKVDDQTSGGYCETLRKHWLCFDRVYKEQHLYDHDSAEQAKLVLNISASVNRHWSKQQIIDFFNSAAAARYEAKWQLCTIKEKVLLICLLNGDIPNPRNSVPLEHLVRRGYIFYDQGWHIVNDSFGRYVMMAEEPATVRRWLHDIEESLWKYTRIPLFIGLLLLLGMLAYTATDSLQSLMALLATMLGILPVIFNNISLFKVMANNGN